MRRRTKRIVKRVVAGAIGGLAASLAMNQFQVIWSKAEEAVSNSKTPQGEDATVKIARNISRKVCNADLTEPQKKVAGPIVHYGFGTLLGALYGALAETVPLTSAGYGIPYGSAVWLLADEVAVPALGLSKAPNKAPIRSHIQALASHCVYGLAADLTRRAILKKVA